MLDLIGKILTIVEFVKLMISLVKFIKKLLGGKKGK